MRVILKVTMRYFARMLSRRMQNIVSIFETCLFILDDSEAVSMSTIAAMISTPMICGAYYYIGDAISEMAMTLNYLGCLGCAMLTIYNVEKAFIEFANLPHNSKAGRTSNVKKKRKKKKYKIKGHCYKRNYKRKFSYNPRRWWKYSLVPKEPPDTTVDGWASEAMIPPWRTMIHYGNVWDELCKKNSMIMDLAMDFKFMAWSSSLNKVMSSAFTVADKVYDLSTIVEKTGVNFRSQAVYNFDTGPVLIFDTGASIGVSPCKEDFVTLDTSASTLKHHSLHGVSNQSIIKGVGKAKWLVHTDNGAPRYIEQMCYYVPDAKVRLFSVCNYTTDSANKGSSFVIDKLICFNFATNTGGGKLHFDLMRHGVPATTAVHQHFKSEKGYHNSRLFGLVHDDNINLTPGQKELLKWHFRLGHWNLAWIQSLIRKGILHVKDQRASQQESLCGCAACNLAKQVRKSEGTVKHSIRKEKDGKLKEGNLRPGAMISSDQYVSSVPGRLPNTYGKETAANKYMGGTIFIDEASGFTFIKNQVSLGAAETIRAKHEFERDAQRNGIRISSYRADNGVYRSAAFREDLNKFKQTIQFSPVGGHHHNGVSERSIRTITTCARAMIIHALIHNPTEVELELWPFAMEYAVFLWNKMPKQDGRLSPEEIYYGIKSDYHHLKDARTWGCPAYVLDPTLQDGKKLPRWKPRSRLGQFLGRSREHAGSVGLIRNLKTGGVSPQFNVVYDDQFTTVGSDITRDNIPVPEGFDELLKYSREYLLDPEDIGKPKSHVDKVLDVERVDNIDKASRKKKVSFAPEGVKTEDNSASDTVQQPAAEQEQEPRAQPSAQPSNEPASIPTVSPKTETTMGNSRYPVRERKPVVRYSEEYAKTVLIPADVEFHDLFLFESNLNRGHSAMTAQYDLFNIMKQEDGDEDLIEALHPLAFAARASAEDTPYFHEAMNGPDAAGFRQAMEDEVNLLEEMDSWNVVPREKAIREGKRVLNSVWSFKRKRFPDGTVKKLKARFCIHGGQQEEGVDFDDTFSPVVGWSTVRIMLILSIVMELKTKQVDFTLAFVQAKLDPGTYIEMPRLFEEEGKVLELKRNLYGGRDAGANFFFLLKNSLRSEASDRLIQIHVYS